jgi:hypothetical protein
MRNSPPPSRPMGVRVGNSKFEIRNAVGWAGGNSNLKTRMGGREAFLIPHSSFLIPNSMMCRLPWRADEGLSSRPLESGELCVARNHLTPWLR